MNTTDLIKTEAQTLLEKMITTFSLEVEEDKENNAFFVTIKTDDEASVVIGRHGETIRAIQKILEVILYKATGEPTHLLLNVNDYRQKQRERLEQVAADLAEKTRQTTRPSHYRGLSSFERKLIHEFITQNYSDLTTYSVGEGRDRHLVIDIASENQREE